MTRTATLNHRTMHAAWAMLLFGLLSAWILAAPVAGQTDEHDDHGEKEAHTDHDGRVAEGEHVDHDEHGEERSVHLSKAEMAEFGIRVSAAGPGAIGPTIKLAGEIVANPDRYAHVVPRVEGVVRGVRVGLGDRVRSGDVMAVLDSRELSDLKSAYLSAVERRDLAEAAFAREERLWKQSISSEREFLAAKQAVAEARIEARSAEHKLHALGFSESYLNELPTHADISYTRFEIRAPLDGVVVSKHITLGEAVDADTEVFSVADLREVWAVLAVYQKDLEAVREGMRATIRDREGGEDRADGQISYVSPVIDEATRTANARVVVENANGRWRPGMFVSARAVVEGRPVPVAIPVASVQNLEEEKVVFVYDGDEFEMREVRIGQSTDEWVEILSGLQPGESIATHGAFTLKTQIQKGEFESGHSH